MRDSFRLSVDRFQLVQLQIIDGCAVPRKNRPLLRRLPRPEPCRILPQPRKPRRKFRRNHVIGCFSRFRAHLVRKDRRAVIIEQKAYIDAPLRLLQNFRALHVPLPKLPIPFVPIARGQLQRVICPQRARLPRNQLRQPHLILTFIHKRAHVGAIFDLPRAVIGKRRHAVKLRHHAPHRLPHRHAPGSFLPRCRHLKPLKIRFRLLRPHPVRRHRHEIQPPSRGKVKEICPRFLVQFRHRSHAHLRGKNLRKPNGRRFLSRLGFRRGGHFLFRFCFRRGRFLLHGLGRLLRLNLPFMARS